MASAFTSPPLPGLGASRAATSAERAAPTPIDPSHTAALDRSPDTDPECYDECVVDDPFPEVQAWLHCRFETMTVSQAADLR
jgi:hypothetical protein